MSGIGVERIVERQMRNWELARSQRDAEAAPESQRVFEFFAISRESGSGGLTLARELGRQIGWEVYDSEILNYMAQDNAVQQRIYEFADEHSVGYLESFLKNLGFEGQPPGADYFRKLVSSVNAIARANHAIFVGRGASFILPREHGLRVRVIAPAELRVQHWAEFYGCTIDEAKSAVPKADADRDKFLREHFRIEPTSFEHYDVIINSGTVSAEAATAMLVVGLEHKTNVRLRRP